MAKKRKSLAVSSPCGARSCGSMEPGEHPGKKATSECRRSMDWGRSTEMKKGIIAMMMAMILAGGVLGPLPPPSQAQIYVPPPPPPAPRPVAVPAPWVGPNTPWVFYQGDWFLNGVLHNFFGNRYGWAPYYAYAPTYIVRPTYWYAPRWNTWYKAHPVYWTNFHRQYPYWHGHQPGRLYDQAFYDKYHHGQGGGWQRGFPPAAPNPSAPVHRNRPPEAGGAGYGHPFGGKPAQYQPGQPTSPGSHRPPE